MHAVLVQYRFRVLSSYLGIGVYKKVFALGRQKYALGLHVDYIMSTVHRLQEHNRNISYSQTKDSILATTFEQPF